MVVDPPLYEETSMRKESICVSVLIDSCFIGAIILFTDLLVIKHDIVHLPCLRVYTTNTYL